MKKCKCGSREFSATQKQYVKFLLDGNLKGVGSAIRNPKFLDGLIKCEKCGEEYSDTGFENLED